MSSFTKIKKAVASGEKKRLARFYNINSMLGNDWAIFYIILGARMTGKSYSVTDFLCNQKEDLKDNVKNYWLRISETSTKALLQNKAEKLVDPDLKRKYDLDLTTKGDSVYNKGKPFMEVIPLSKFAKTKGVGYFDKDYTGWYNIVLDEFQLEQGEKRTSFSVLYNFIGMCENLVRTTKHKVRVFLLGNTLEEASTILKAFEFLPEKPGRFYLKRKRCVIDNLEVTDEYKRDRSGSIADILGGSKLSNFTNELKKSMKQVDKSRCITPTAIIKFTKSPDEWYTVWDGKIIKKYNREKVLNIIAMRPYLGELYTPERRQLILDMYDSENLFFNNLITQAYFEESLTLIRK